ncbi:uncharacterized protein LOC126571694 isoform X2 [Anopheles aquasalis]|nr:uncharacterized protein LOC126571694 isoform X2 [Anopheles aquasalis]
MTERLQQQIVVLDEGAHASTFSRVSPPKAVIDSSPLQSAMDKNKESLKVKLLVRRSFNQLVEQGIMPPLKTSPAIYEQRRQLERAKTGDLLKAKIKKRPDRVELEQRHILEQCDSNVDPSLAEKRRALEKALLVDHLNSKISHRPGPLDLIGKNILHADEPIERIVKQGLVDYASTLDESSVATPTTVGEGEDSLSSEGESLQGVTVTLVTGQHEQLPPPPPPPQPPATTGGTVLVQHAIQLPMPSTHAALQPAQILTVQPEFFTLKPAIPIVANDGTVLATIAAPVLTPSTAAVASSIATNITSTSQQPQQQSEKVVSTQSNLRPILPSAKPVPDLPPLSLTMTPSMTIDLKHLNSNSINSTASAGTGGKDKSMKKKCKARTITKARSIKFHEYKGPSGSHKGSSGHAGSGGSTNSSDNNYQLIMKQQHLLEYLEEMCKKPTGIPSPSANRDQQSQQQQQQQPQSSSALEGTDGETAGVDHTPIDSPITSSKSASSGTNSAAKASSGVDPATEILSKYKVSQLKKYCKQHNLPVSGTKSNLIERLRTFLKTVGDVQAMSILNATALDSSTGGTDAELEGNRLAEQQKRIAELQLQLQRSQEQLEQFRSMCTNQFVAPGTPVPDSSAPVPPPPPPPPPPANMVSTSSGHLAVDVGMLTSVGSPFETQVGEITAGNGEGSIADSAGTSSDGPVAAVLDDGFFLSSLSTADSTTVDYDHGMETMLHSTVPATLPAVEHSPTHHTTLDKVLGQVQPTISSLAMAAEASEDRGSAAPVMHGVAGSIGVLGNGAVCGSNSGPLVGDLHNLAISMKSVKFETNAGDDSMQQDTIMMNDFGDIDLVDFHMQSLDSDGPFPMITNHDPVPNSSGTETDQHHHHQHSNQHEQHHHQQQQQQQQRRPSEQQLSESSTAMHGPLSLFGVPHDPNALKILSNGFGDQLHASETPGVVDVLQQQTYMNNNDIIGGVVSDCIEEHGDPLRLGLLGEGERQPDLTLPVMKLFGEANHHQHPAHLHLPQPQHQLSQQQSQQQQHLHQHNQQQQSDSNNNFGANPSIGAFRFAIQQHQQHPVACSSSSSSSSSTTSASSTSSSPGSCFKTPASLNANMSKTQGALHLSNHNASPHNHHQQLQQQQQQQQQQHHPQHHHQLQLQNQLGHHMAGQATSSNSSNNVLMSDEIESFQDNAMDFESLLTNDTDADGVLTANTCHRMMLDCAQDKPLFNFLPETSILDYFNEDCNGHDFEIKHVEY